MARAVSHDQNFKNLILDYPRQALAFFAPEEAPAPGDDVEIVPLRQEQLQERLGQRYHELDAPLQVQWADGRREAVVFALEEETDGSRFSPHRLARYCWDVAELFDTNRVVPVSIFLRAGPAPARLALGTERRDYLTFDHLSCRLDALDARAWLHSDNAVALVNLPNMRRPAGMDRVDVFARAAHGLRALEPDGTKLAKYLQFIDIYAALTENEQETYRRRYPEESRTMAGMIQRRTTKVCGKACARAAWTENGRPGAAVAAALRAAAPAVADRLHQAPAADLEAWAENVLDARTLDDVFDADARGPGRRSRANAPVARRPGRSDASTARHRCVAWSCPRSPRGRPQAMSTRRRRRLACSSATPCRSPEEEHVAVLVDDDAAGAEVVVVGVAGGAGGGALDALERAGAAVLEDGLQRPLHARRLGVADLVREHGILHRGLLLRIESTRPLADVVEGGGVRGEGDQLVDALEGQQKDGGGRNGRRCRRCSPRRRARRRGPWPGPPRRGSSDR